VASQQGEYLGKKFTKLAKQHDTLVKNEIPDMDDAAYSKPFKCVSLGILPAALANNLGNNRYMHLGSLAYVGNS
jgi:NADH dehydrogenase FAD-containing subunit